MRRLAVAVLLAAGAHASTGGKPRKDLPPLFLVPSLLAASFYLAWQEEHADEVFKDKVAEKRRLSQKKSAEIHSEDSDRRESRVMTTSTNSVLIGGAGPDAPMAPAVAVKPMSVDEKNRAIRARAVAEAKK